MNTSGANHDMSRDLYRTLQEIVKKYGIKFIDNDQFVEAFIEDAFYHRQEFNKKSSIQELYDALRIDLSRGLIYVLKLIEGILNKEYSLGTRIRYKNYYISKISDHNTLCLDFNEVQAHIGVGLNGVIISWRIIPRQYQNLAKWNYSWLTNDLSPQALTHAVKDDVEAIKDELLKV